MIRQARPYTLGAVIDRVAAAAWTFTGRPGGVSTGVYESLNLADHVGDDPVAVSANRGRAAAVLGLGLESLAVMQANHGNDVAVADRGGTYPGVDILVTRRRDLALMALAADCATIALVDPQAGVIGAVHSGWRGVVADTAGAAVSAMSTEGAQPQQIRATLGPVVCAGCYEVSPEVQDRVASRAPAARARTRQGTAAVNLHAAIAEQLRRAGVASITADPVCTAESPDLFSHRRDGVTGRHGMLIRLGEGS